MHREHRDAGEGFVDLEQIDIAKRPAGLGQHIVDRADRGGGEVLGGLRERSDGDHAGERGQSLVRGHAGTGQHHCRRAIRDRAGGGGGDRAVLREGGFERGNLVGLALAGGLIGIDDCFASAADHRDRGDFSGKGAFADCGLRAAQRFDRIGVLRLTGQLVFVGSILSESAHRAARFVGVFQSVKEHVIVSGIMPDPRARAVLLEQVRGVGHAFHAARNHHVDAPRGERFGAHDQRLHARSADLVDRGRLDRSGQAGLDRRLAGRGLTKSSRQHAAHINALDIAARHAGAFDRRPYRSRAEIGRRNVRQYALHRAHRGARVRQDDDRIVGGELGHGVRAFQGDGKLLARQ